LIAVTPERRTHDYKRNGVTNRYAALDVASGNVIADMIPRHRAGRFRRFPKLIDKFVPADLDVRVNQDLAERDPKATPIGRPSSCSTTRSADHERLVKSGRPGGDRRNRRPTFPA
jgi:hypothetical protein